MLKRQNSRYGYRAEGYIVLMCDVRGLKKKYRLKTAAAVIGRTTRKVS